MAGQNSVSLLCLSAGCLQLGGRIMTSSPVSELGVTNG